MLLLRVSKPSMPKSGNCPCFPIFMTTSFRTSGKCSSSRSRMDHGLSTGRVTEWLCRESRVVRRIADEDCQQGRICYTKPFHRLSYLQHSYSQAQTNCPSRTMQELP